MHLERICICIYLLLLIGIIDILSIENTSSNNAGFEGIINIINKPTSSIYNSSSTVVAAGPGWGRFSIPGRLLYLVDGFVLHQFRCVHPKTKHTRCILL